MHKTRVGVLRGGPSTEYDVSLKTGASVLRHLAEDRYHPIDILIDRDGRWHMGGVEMPPERIIPHIDVAFNALHGHYGEDGKVQQLLDNLNIPYTGSGALSSALGMNKALSKEYFAEAGLKTPFAKTVSLPDDVDEIDAGDWQIFVLELWRTFPQPSVLKPVNGGSSVGTSIARTYEEFAAGLERAFGYATSVLVEEYIPGREVTVGVIDGFRGEEYYVLPAIEIITPKTKSFFDYEAKYSGQDAGGAQEICPAPLEDDIREAVADIALAAHKALHLRHYSRSDIIIGKRGIYILETNTLPGLTEESLVPKALAAVGCKFPEFLDHLITLALTK